MEKLSLEDYRLFPIKKLTKDKEADIMITRIKKGAKVLLSYWKKFAKGIGIVQTTIILFIIYIIAVGPISLISKISGKDLLDRKFKWSNSSYWKKKEETPFKLENFLRQF